MKKLIFFKGYQQDDKKRTAFNALAVKTFDLSFEEWYQSGYWRDKYIPYTLFDGEQAVANVSVNIIDFSIFGHKQRTIQLGTVMTDDAYRNQGLSRMLMEKVFEDWKADNHLIYLFANSTVWGFYPKLGFKSVKEYQYQRTTTPSTQASFVKLNMNKKENREQLYDYAQNTDPYGKISMQENADLVMFYCITVYKDNVFYLPELDAIAIAEIKGRQLHLLDVYSKKEHNLDDIIHALSDETTDTVRLGFVPKDCSSYEIIPVDEQAKDEMLFVEEDKTSLFDENQLMFPLLSHA
ncbi:TPA: GNAT family N-acetyltransferase [Legionella pneumophila]|uniref:Predicted acetyltransferase involved in intracellular survival and related acetyltransferases n=2 Tax=Legionellaceae TaxID=444 RepID=A0A377GB72_9GAMM|nr:MULTISPECIES: GNAT family N-acetyltransferase [Legionellaceae]HAT9631503.1 GNAT family N-acetyltransferase [Legionella pneumophila subsp. pneumophila]KTC90401.1 Acetyltransferase (GNAT) family protein [Fluoribacter dumoffii NY 23]KTD68993.1 Acetyltransferase (GNAT) family protein [Legionella steelei]MCW8483255.1 GNAT family N-acetyltransferase [Fluoribacter dumoffii]STO21994.1 Predicted acetyltransferase involved in intracellular survival and related acetyltransferases [Fluoribacter dumoffi